MARVPRRTSSILAIAVVALLAASCTSTASSATDETGATTEAPGIAVPTGVESESGLGEFCDGRVDVEPAEPGTSRAAAPATIDDLDLVACTDSRGFALLTEGGAVEFLTGVNVGSSIPGRLPAELTIDATTWRRWLPMMAEMGFRSIRIYTVQPPHFYEELLGYNEAHPEDPLYLVHGVWVPEELLGEHRDTFHPEVLELVRVDIEDAVRALHGDVVLPERRGYASGTYTADVSPWVASWAFGIEMDPEVVYESDQLNAGRSYDGTYVTAGPAASPTEVWLAEMMDHIASVEVEYGSAMPLTFSNWPTTDPLDHPAEPLALEDLAGIDANNISATEAWPAGTYASYHAYPYYPDFLRWEAGIADYRHDGKADAYAGYLARLRDHHGEAGLAMMVLEFGVPSSLGSAHEGSLGRDQGGHSEVEAMTMTAGLLRTQFDLGLAGGFVFAWQDEWFKRTWNTMDTELPAERRQLWQNPLTNEANFGLIAMDPGAGGPPVYIDGVDDDWKVDNSQVILESWGAVREVRATHDEAYLYLRLVLDEAEIWNTTPVVVGFDTVPGGGGGLPGSGGAGTDADTAIVVGPGHEAGAYVRASNDYNSLVMGLGLGFFAVDQADVEEGSGVWNPQRLIINRPLHIPVVDIERPAEWFDLNPLPTGSSEPASPLFDSRTLWAASGSVIEMRVPWAVIGFSDPSSRSGLAVSRDGILSTHEVERLGITVAIGVTATGPAAQSTNGYAWEPWQAVEWTERTKAGLRALIDVLAQVRQ
ncbi:MAG: hypothetical protein GY925_30175 [Actinomycetia bacterium]|nr:hypothetical protein [Actinomycetes bacterium]